MKEDLKSVLINYGVQYAAIIIGIGIITMRRLELLVDN